MCGADARRRNRTARASGSSPRVRSGRRHVAYVARGDGDHLRVCGADRLITPDTKVLAGSSPRVRSGRPPRRGPGPPHGIISACAERTRTRPGWRRQAGDHLRVCGADRGDDMDMGQTRGSSPRVRSGRQHGIDYRVDDGIISACAERTILWTGNGWRYRGSSPRVRSGPHGIPPRPAEPGIISACAERTKGAG